MSSECYNCNYVCECLGKLYLTKVCPMYREKPMNVESRNFETSDYYSLRGWVFKANDITHTIKDVTLEPKEVDLPVVYIKRNINLRRD